MNKFIFRLVKKCAPMFTYIQEIIKKRGVLIDD